MVGAVLEPRGSNLTFMHPSYGPGTYALIKEWAEKDGLRTPTMAEIVSLVHAAFNSDNKYSHEIRDQVRFSSLLAFTGTLYVPKKGAYVQDSPEINKGVPSMPEFKLLQRLEAGDSSVRFVPFG